MSEYCCPISNNSGPDHSWFCPQDGTQGQPVALITLKSLLTSSALMQLDPLHTYRFCPSGHCQVVYFSHGGQIFTTTDLKVPVYQKAPGAEVPICYCFEWTWQRLREEIQQQPTSSAISSIRTQIKAKRCGCEVRNP